MVNAPKGLDSTVAVVHKEVERCWSQNLISKQDPAIQGSSQLQTPIFLRPCFATKLRSQYPKTLFKEYHVEWLMNLPGKKSNETLKESLSKAEQNLLHNLQRALGIQHCFITSNRVTGMSACCLNPYPMKKSREDPNMTGASSFFSEEVKPGMM